MVLLELHNSMVTMVAVEMFSKPNYLTEEIRKSSFSAVGSMRQFHRFIICFKADLASKL